MICKFLVRNLKKFNILGILLIISVSMFLLLGNDIGRMALLFFIIFTIINTVYVIATKTKKDESDREYFGQKYWDMYIFSWICMIIIGGSISVGMTYIISYILYFIAAIFAFIPLILNMIREYKELKESDQKNN